MNRSIGRFLIYTFVLAAFQSLADRALADSASSATSAQIAGSRGSRAVSSFANFGVCTGCSGLISYRHNDRTEYFASVSGNFLGPDYALGPRYDYWYAITYDAESRNFTQVFVSDRLPGGIAQLLLVPGSGDEDDRVAVCGYDASIRFYSARTKELLANETLQFPSQMADSYLYPYQQEFRCAIGDFAHTGSLQYLMATPYQAAVYDRSGAVLWSMPPPSIDYNDILVGRMAAGPELDIATAQFGAPFFPGVASLAIYDGATHALKLQFSPTAVPTVNQLALAAVGPDASPALIVSQQISNEVDALNPVSGALLWRLPQSDNIQTMKVAHLLNSLDEQLLIGESSSVQVVDPITGTPQFSISNSLYGLGVTRMAVGDIEGNDQRALLWGTNADDEGPHYFVLADIQARQVIATTLNPDGDFASPAIGHLTAGRSRQIVTSTQTTNGGYSGGTLLAFDADTGRELAIQNVPFDDPMAVTNYALRVVDLDGNGIDKILVAGSYGFQNQGVLQVYGLTPERQFVLKSTTAGPNAPVTYSGYTALAIGHTDPAATPYAVVGFDDIMSRSAPAVPTIIGADISTGTELWRAPLPPVNFNFGPDYGSSPTAIEAMGRDESGAQLFVVLRSGAYEQTGWIDIVRVARGGASVVGSYRGLISSIDVKRSGPAAHHLLAGTYDGKALVLALQGSSLSVVSTRQVSSNSVDAIKEGRDGELWIVSGQRAERVNSRGQIVWQSTDNGYTAPAGIALDTALEGAPRVWVSSVLRVDAFDPVGADRH
jgi:hypothetical protein